MSQEQVEMIYAKTIEQILEMTGNATANFLPVLGVKSIEMAIGQMEEYLEMLKNLRVDYEKEPNLQSCMSPRLNDSMLIHRNRLARTSKSRLALYRTSPEIARFSRGSPDDIENENLSMSKIRSITEETSILDPTLCMDETTHQRGFLADVSDMNGTVRSRMPSFNFNHISPVPAEKTRRHSVLNVTTDFDVDLSSLCEPSQIEENSGQILFQNVLESALRTPNANNNTILLTDSEVTPVNISNLWNVKLRPGSNRKIDNGIRKEIQRQSACDSQL